MTTPVEPVVPEPSLPDPATPAEATPASPVEPTEGGEDSELRTLVQELVKQSQLGFDPTTMRKGIITAVNPFFVGTPTVDLTMSGDDTVVIPGVRFLDSYSPLVGDSVLVMKQGADIMVLGRVAIGISTDVGWVQATLASGFTHDSGSLGALTYRRVWDNGSWKVQFRGGVLRSANETVISALPADFRPPSRATVLGARGHGGGSVAIQIQFETNGAVLLSGNTFNIAMGSPDTLIQNTGNVGSSTPTLIQNTGTFGSNTVKGSNEGTNNTSDNADNTFSSVTGDHNHAIHHTHFGPLHSHYCGAHVHDMNHSHAVNGHIHDMNHSHTGGAATVTATDWISFHGVEYFQT
jgi:hypothetical protein